MVKKYPPKKIVNTAPIKEQQKLNLNWSEYQKDIFRDIANGTGNTIVIARAGSAKTTSLVEGSKYIPKGKKSLFCAFNKSIQEELRLKLGNFIECLTLHALGFRGIRQRFGNVELNNRKTWSIVETLVEEPKQNYDLIDGVCKTVSLCKATLANTTEMIEKLIIDFDIDLCNIPVEEFVKLVFLALKLGIEKTDVIDFDDMIFLPLIYKINVGSYEMIFVDEAHDLNKSQIELALSALKPDGRIIVVMDPNQAIYAWRGADSSMLDNLKQRLSPKELPLPICYRCPKKVIEAAKQFVPDIQAYDQAEEGTIQNITFPDLYKLSKPGSYVISRYNAPLVKHCMGFLKRMMPANILGRDIGNNLSKLIKRSKKKTIKDFLSWLDNWEKLEKEKLLAKYPNADTDGITDKAECLYNLCEDMVSLDQVKDNIEKLFKDNGESGITLFSSIHRIKGKENKNVFILADTLRKSSQEELNIEYVAITRSMENLYYVWKKLP